MKNLVAASAIIISAVLITACGEQKQSGVDAQPGATKSAEPVPIQERFEKVTTKFDAPAFGSIDGINDSIMPKTGSTVVVKGEKITIAGNYVDAVRGEAAAGVIALIDGKPYVAIYGGERPDIAKALNNPKYLNSQFYVEVPVASVGAGLHDLKIRVIAADKSGYYESSSIVKLDVR